MAAPVTHIVLTEKVYQKYFSDKKKASFYAGTSFPDIRYLGEIDRSKVHFKDVKLSEVQIETSFFAGLKFHSLLDEIRESFVKSQKLYSFLPDSEHRTQAVKLVEDKLLYGRIGNWAEIKNYFDNVLKQELSLGVSLAGVRRWHTLLKNYFSRKPRAGDIINFFRELGWSSEVLEELTSLIEVIDNKPEIERITFDFYDKFEDLLKVKS